MARVNLPRQTTDGPKHLTPPAPKPKVPRPPHIREGDVLLIRDRYTPYGGRVGVVVRVASGKSGSHRVIDGGGRELDVVKHSQLRPGMSDPDPITIIGHDEEWLRAEKKIVADRTKLARPHDNEATRVLREERQKGK